MAERTETRRTTQFVAQHMEQFREFGLVDPATPLDGEASLEHRRRNGVLGGGEGVQQVVLMEGDGVLRWDFGRMPEPAPLEGRRGGHVLQPSAGQVVLPLRFRELPPSEVWGALMKIDTKLSGDPGWSVWRGDVLHPAPVNVLDGKKRVLLFVHGTFASAQAIVDGIKRCTSTHDAFWTWAKGNYDLVLFLNHHTLRPTPVANAMALAQFFDGRDVAVDAIGHSRGCLILRWWLEALDRGRGRRRAVFVGGALSGTSLAAPPKLRAAIGLLTNLLRVVHGTAAAATAVVPALAPLVALMRILSFATNGLASTPLLDAGVAIVPGLAAMSRVGNNAELAALRARARNVPRGYFAVQSNFEPEDPAWRFWRHFRGTNLADSAADAIFADANDLVVDTSSMTELGEQGAVIPRGKRVLDFGTSSKVHHLNYFEQPETLNAMMDWLGPEQVRPQQDAGR